MSCVVSVYLLGPILTRLPSQDYWSHELTRQYWVTATAFKVAYRLPGVFDDTPLPHAVNGSLRSLAYEMRCYTALIAVAVLPLPLRWKVLGLLAMFALAFSWRPPGANVFEHYWGLDYFGIKLGWMFFVGCALAAWRDILYGARLATLAGVALALAWLAPPAPTQWLLIWLGVACGIVWLVRHATCLPQWPQRWGDWSYGVYLYGFPVQQTLAHWRVHEHGIAVYVIASTLVTLPLAAMSWHMLEKHALRWKT